MNIALRTPRMTREAFFDWAQAQNARYEFDGFQPVAMTGGSLNHNQISHNIYGGLRTRLRGSGCRPFGQDAGLATIGDAVRYPDALVTCSKVSGTARLVPGVVVVFEVLSPTSGRTDRIEKVREYHAVPSIRRYVILERASIGATVLVRADGAEAWAATALTEADTLRMPEIGIEIPLTDFYEDVERSPPAHPDSDSAATA